MQSMAQQQHVFGRYSQAAQSAQADLCWPVDFNMELPVILPHEIVDKDYGGGKVCYMAARQTRLEQKLARRLDAGAGKQRISYVPCY